MSEKILVTAAEAARMLSIDSAEFLAEVQQKRLPSPVSLAGKTLWRVEDLQAAVRRKRQTSRLPSHLGGA